MSLVRWIAGIAGAVAAGLGSYRLITLEGCTVWWPGSNLCGMMGVPAACVGAVVGFAVCFWIGSKLTR